MRRFVTVMAVLATVIFLFAAHTYWKGKTSAGTKAPAVTEEAVKNVMEKEENVESKSANQDLLTLADNWPDQAKEGLEKAMEEGRAYKVAVVGSGSLGEENGGWSVMLRDALGEAFGDHVEVGIFEYDERSDEFISNSRHNEVAEFEPDFVLFEPFTLMDNGNVEVEDNHENIQTFVDAVGEAVVVLQPPHPIHDATFYPAQVNDLKTFAEDADLVYLDHWPEWPDVEDEELRSYLQEDQGAPNEKGHELWFEYLKGYFIAE